MVPENEYHPYYKPYIDPLASSEKSIVARESTSDTLNKLDKGFVQIHKSYIVPIGKISEIDSIPDFETARQDRQREKSILPTWMIDGQFKILY